MCYACHICKLHGSSDKEFLDIYLKKVDELIPKEVQEKIYLDGNKVIKDNQLEDIEAMLNKCFTNLKNSV